MISIIIPVYNVKEYLDKCVRSVLEQTYTDIEVILVDDGSTDGSGDICDGYVAKDPRVTALHKTNGGLSDARNYGIDQAHGDLIGFVDGDDWIHPQMYEILLKVMEDSGADIAACRFTSDEKDRFMDPIDPDSLSMEVFSSTQAMINFRKTFVCAWNKLYRCSIFDDLRYPVGRLHEDEYLLHYIYRRCDRVAVVDSTLYFYVQRTGSIVNRLTDRRIDDALYALTDRIDYAVEEKWDEVLVSAVEYYCEYCIYGYYYSIAPEYEPTRYTAADFVMLEKQMLKRFRSRRIPIKYRLFAISPRLYEKYVHCHE